MGSQCSRHGRTAKVDVSLERVRKDPPSHNQDVKILALGVRAVKNLPLLWQAASIAAVCQGSGLARSGQDEPGLAQAGRKDIDLERVG